MVRHQGVPRFSAAGPRGLYNDRVPRREPRKTYEPTRSARVPEAPQDRSGEESDLERRYRNLTAVIDTMNCGLLGRDRDGRIVFVNDRLLSWLGYTLEEMLGKTVDRFAPPDLHDLYREEIEAISEGDHRARLAALARKDGTVLPVITIPQSVYDSEGRYVRTYSLVVDFGTIMTAKDVGGGGQNDVRSRLIRVALELKCISAAMAGDAPVPVLLDHPDLEDLSSREKEVMVHLVGGHRVPGIATRLFISQHTVRNHLKSIYRKIDVGSQSELIERVRSLGD